MLTVVAALIAFDGKLLVCQRKRGDRFELLWEFPGGKIEPRESPQQALLRELREELAVEAEIGEQAHRTRHHYPEIEQSVELIFFFARVEPSAIENREFERIEWREPGSLRDLNFLPADRELVERLATGELRLPANRPRKT